jgi:hypothetical protein
MLLHCKLLSESNVWIDIHFAFSGESLFLFHFFYFYGAILSLLLLSYEKKVLSLFYFYFLLPYFENYRLEFTIRTIWISVTWINIFSCYNANIKNAKVN